MQLVMAGNDTQGLRYGTIETPEKHYLEWKEDCSSHEPNRGPYDHKLDFHLSRVCNKARLLQIIHDFIVFDAGIKRPVATINSLVLKRQNAISQGEKAALFGTRKVLVKASLWCGWPNGYAKMSKTPVY